MRERGALTRAFVRALTPALLVPGACGPGEPAPDPATSGVVVRDSAGIEIVEELLDPTPRPDFIPPVGMPYPGDVASGGVIVSRRDTDPNLFEDGDPNVFDVFDGTGRFRGRLTTDGTFFPAVLSGDELIGWIRDAFDVPYVVRYRLTFP